MFFTDQIRFRYFSQTEYAITGRHFTSCALVTEKLMSEKSALFGYGNLMISTVKKCGGHTNPVFYICKKLNYAIIRHRK